MRIIDDGKRFVCLDERKFQISEVWYLANFLFDFCCVD